MAVERQNDNQADTNSTPAVLTILKAFNATTGEQIGELPISDEAEVKAVVARARAAQTAWGKLSLKQRGAYLYRFRDIMINRAEEIARLISQETGKPAIEGLITEVVAAADIISYYVKNAPQMLADEPVKLHLMKHRKSYLHYTPLGVIGIISPWNFPFILGLSEVLVALLAGNAVVLKPSEFTPMSAQIISDMFTEINLPENVFQIIHGEGPTGSALVKSEIDKLCFTGGGSTARRIMAAASENLTPVVFELGGKDPLIVCADADVERAAQAAVWGGFANCGQICASVERVYVHKNVAEPFIQRTAELTRKLRIGNATENDDVDVGSMIHERQVQISEQQIDDAVEKGAKILTGGKRPTGLDGPFFEPTVLVNVDHTMDVMTEETFGPLLPIKVVEDDAEAIRLANESNLGLNAYVFSKDSAHADEVARQIEAGSVLINDVIFSYSVPEAPWGGVKQSGIGRVHGGEIGLREFCQVRHVMGERIHIPNKKELWWYPYKASQIPFFTRTLKLLFKGKK